MSSTPMESDPAAEEATSATTTTTTTTATTPATEPVKEDTNDDSSAKKSVAPTPSKQQRQRAAKAERERLQKIRAEQKKAVEDMRRAQNERVKEQGESVDKKEKLTALLKQMDVYAHFMGSEASAAAAADGKKGQKKRRMTEKEEDAQLLKAAKDKVHLTTRLLEQPPCIVDASGQGCRMRPYQLEGLNWIIRLYESGINGILADEMGLGKTLQTIAMLGYLKESRGVPGPHLVIVPKSTVRNWEKECRRWCPSLRPFRLIGSRDERREQIATHLQPDKFDVCVTTYEVAIIEKAALKKFSWTYLVIDEAHRIKNEASKLSQVVRQFDSQHRLLITGTPLQNNLHELWALLNFLLPDLFGDADEFSSWFDLDDKETQQEAVSKLHKVLRPFLLRRLKTEVEKSLLPKKEIKLFVGLSAMQREWYQNLLKRDIDALQASGLGKASGGKTRLMNMVMQLRKLCNHPYLFDGAEKKDPVTGEYTTDEHLVFNSGKMVVLDRLLPKLRAAGSKVLIFSQMTRVLDILEDYCGMREYQFCRIDGSTAMEDREAGIEQFQAPGSEKFIFMLTTRAGGLGITLTAADTVVMFDSDWNPQVDLQAMDRCHRIGQTRQVTVYRFVTDQTIEEKIVERAEAKLHLDALVVQQGRLAEKVTGVSKDELLGMIRFGASEIFRSRAGTITEDDIDAIIERGKAKTEEISNKLKDRFQKTKLDLANFALDGGVPRSLYEFEGTDYADLVHAHGGARANWIELPKRDSAMRVPDELRATAPRRAEPSAPRRPDVYVKPGQPRHYDHQFFPPRVYELFAKENELYEQLQHTIEAKEVEVHAAMLAEREARNDHMPLSTQEVRRRAVEQVDASQFELSADERAELDRLYPSEGFAAWTRAEFRTYVRALQEHGRGKLDAVAAELAATKTADEVKRYHVFFWRDEHYKRLKKWKTFTEAIEKAEEKREQHSEMLSMLTEVIGRYENAWRELPIAKKKGGQQRSFTPDEDRFLLCMVNEIGYGNWDQLKDEVHMCNEFRFDWFFKSRTTDELRRRVDTLLRQVLKENSRNGAGGGGGGNGKGKGKKRAASSNGSAAPGAKKAKA